MADEWTRANERLFSSWADERVRGMERRHAPAVSMVIEAFNEAFSRRRDATRPFRLMDVGCGSGSLLRALRGSISPEDRVAVELVGLDVSPVMIARASRAARDGSRSITFVQGDAVEKVRDLGTFDMICSVESIYYMSDMARAVHALLSAVRDAGFVIIIVEEDMIAAGDIQKDTARLAALRSEIDVDRIHFLTLEAYVDLLVASGSRLPVIERRDGFLSMLARCP